MRVIEPGRPGGRFEMIEATDVPEKLVSGRGCEAVDVIGFEAMLPI
jgi:hypothetical protein